MAITVPPFFPQTIADTDISGSLQIISFENIQGKLLTANISVSETEAMMNMMDDKWRKHIKEKLAIDMAKTMLQNNLCDFTTHLDPFSMQRRFNIRCFLTTDDQVRIIKKLNDTR